MNQSARPGPSRKVPIRNEGVELGTHAIDSAPIVFLLGKPPRPGTLVARVLDRLQSDGVTVDLHLPHETDRFDPGLLPSEGLIVHRGLRPDILEKLAPLEAAGRRFCNRVTASIAVADRSRQTSLLAAARLPVPHTRLAKDWLAAHQIAGERDVVVKAIDGSRGRSAGIAFPPSGCWPIEPPFGGPVMVQDRVDHDGWDCKLYVAGACRGLLKPSMRPSATGEPFEPDSSLRILAEAVGVGLCLDIYGVDMLVTSDGPVIVDVNPFPGFRGITDAAPLVASHLRKLAPDQPHSSTRV